MPGARVVVDVVRRAPGDVLLQVRGVVTRQAVGHLRRELDRLLDTGATAVLVDFSAVPQCDCRVLPVLDDICCRLGAQRGRFAVRGLDPQVLTGFAGASLRDLLAVYRASAGVGQKLWRGEPGGRQATGRYTDAERALVRVCVGLATSSFPLNGRGAARVGDRLTAQCVRHLGVEAALLLVEPHRAEEMSVVSASTPRAWSLADLDARSRHGPMQECRRTGEHLGAPDVDEWDAAWPHFVEAALLLGLRGVRALPLRHPEDTYGVPIGVLGLFSGTAGPMAAADLGVAQGFADLAAVALVVGEDAFAVGPASPDRVDAGAVEAEADEPRGS